MLGNCEFKKNVNRGGTGIGLTLCKKLCDLQGIDLSFDSQIECGTTFSIVIESN